MSAVCNAPESCKAKWERRAFARGVCNARGGWGGGPCEGWKCTTSACGAAVSKARAVCKGKACQGEGVQGDGRARDECAKRGGGRGVECGPE